MFEFFKSKVGWALAGFHLLTVLSCLIYFHLIDDMAVLPLLASIVLTSPWYLLLFYILIPMIIGQERMGGVTSNDFVLISIVSMAIGAAINAFLLYLLGFLLTKAFKYLSSRKSKLS